jgi:hypothetical protein
MDTGAEAKAGMGRRLIYVSEFKVKLKGKFDHSCAALYIILMYHVSILNSSLCTGVDI